MKILQTQNLSKFFEGLKALNRVNIGVEKGSITLVIGPNGSGKTTFINTVSGFYRADEGKVLFEGKDITNKPPHEISKLGIVRTFQIPQPLKKMTVLENLLIAPEGYGERIFHSVSGRWLKEEEDIVEKAFKILEFLKLDHLWDSEAQNLSGGQLKLLEVARAMMKDAKLIIMDEPIAGVNPVLSHSMLERFVELKEMGISFLIVEHRLDIVLKYTDHIYVMANGSVIAEGREEDILNNPKVVEVYLGAQDSEIECGV
ncbi:MAG: ABC transporter ATP-binding protein [Archaeoglobus sp.]|uniref:ABC transporter ATP-binding protein n=1 Tax=Archaeoglobus sp. TaxID=1872626 RepID=UPI001DBE3709|nr:ABC transporter ATP-binding protein [Archaeoglobus sp.]MBO8179721.1 ABC transporter ATP-binding protein [Archaeoglobus sp.]